MALADVAPAWTFQGVQLCRMVDGDSWPTWFAENTLAQIDPILGSNERYVDIGGLELQPLQIRVAFQTKAERDQIRAKRGQIGTLTNVEGDSRRALLQTCQPVGTQYGFYVADVTFQAV